MKTTIKKINGFDVNIIQFSALKALSIRKELVKSLKEQIGNIDISGQDPASLLKGLVGVLYELPPELLLKLFENCSAEGALSDEKNFNRVFENNIDATTELAIEVLEFNGFFSLNIISTLADKVPALAPLKEMINKIA